LVFASPPSFFFPERSVAFFFRAPTRIESLNPFSNNKGMAVFPHSSADQFLFVWTSVHGKPEFFSFRRPIEEGPFPADTDDIEFSTQKSAMGPPFFLSREVGCPPRFGLQAEDPLCRIDTGIGVLPFLSEGETKAFPLRDGVGDWLAVPHPAGCPTRNSRAFFLLDSRLL